MVNVGMEIVTSAISLAKPVELFSMPNSS